MEVGGGGWSAANCSSTSIPCSAGKYREFIQLWAAQPVRAVVKLLESLPILVKFPARNNRDF